MRNNSNDVRAAEDLVVSVVRSYGVSGCEGDGLPPFTVHGRPAVNDEGCESPSSETTFPYVATWAGEAGAALVQATQDRVAAAARVLLASSPAPHADGGKLSTVPLLAPGADPVLGADPAPEPERLGIAG